MLRRECSPVKSRQSSPMGAWTARRASHAALRWASASSQEAQGRENPGASRRTPPTYSTGTAAARWEARGERLRSRCRTARCHASDQASGMLRNAKATRSQRIQAPGRPGAPQNSQMGISSENSHRRTWRYPRWAHWKNVSRGGGERTSATSREGRPICRQAEQRRSRLTDTSLDDVAKHGCGLPLIAPLSAAQSVAAREAHGPYEART